VDAHRGDAVTATNPQPDDPRTPGKTAGPEDLKRGSRKFVLWLLLFLIVVAVAIGLSNCGGDDDPSGGGEQGLGPAVTLEIAPLPS
jgi:hypothetical protein